jgi:SpoVK/Ycf46/Vps4 family AAA+-type ATPase
MGDWTGSDLEKVVREAAMAPIRECIKSATKATRSRDATSKQTLLRSFQNLRPVDVQDLEKAIHFVAPKAWLDNEDDSTDGYSSDDNSRNHSEEE